MSKYKKRKCFRDCQDCDNCVYICEGDFICVKATPFMVISDWCPTDYYCACNNPDAFKQAQQSAKGDN